MKKTMITIAALFALTTVTNAQSGFFVGGGLSLNSSNTDQGGGNENSSSSFGFTPMVGKMLNADFGAGLYLDYSNNATKSTNIAGPVTTENESVNSSFGAGLFARKYFSFSNTFKAVIQADAGFMSGSIENTNTLINGGTTTTTTTTTDMSGFSVNIRPSIAIFLNEHWSTELRYGGIMYNSTTMTPPNNAPEVSTSNFGLDLNANSFGFGIVYYFGG